MQQSFDNNYFLIVVGIVAMTVEVLLGAATGFDLLLIGVIFVVSGGAGLLTNSFTIALVLVAVLSLLYVFVGRRFIKSKLNITTRATGTQALLGKIAVVTKKITAKTPGQVKVDGEIWRASSDQSLDEAEVVVVHSVSGVTLHVGKGKG